MRHSSWGRGSHVERTGQDRTHDTRHDTTGQARTGQNMPGGGGGGIVS
jgi:hypothetical protein